MNQDTVLLIISGFSTILLLIATVTLDRTLFTMEGDYWARFRFIGIRFGPVAFLLWVFFVLVFSR